MRGFPGLPQWIKTTLTGTATSITLTIPDYGEDLEILFGGRGDTNAATVACSVTWNGDTTAANYFYQRAGASGGATVNTSANTAAISVMPALTAATDYFGTLRLFFPQFRNTSIVRDCRFDVIGESSASNRFVHIGSHRRTTAGSGTLKDRIATVNIAAGAGNWIALTYAKYRILS